MDIFELTKEECERIYRNIEKIVLLFPSNINEKQDLIHDAFLHVYKRLKTNYREEGKLDTWVKRVTLNFCNDSISGKSKKRINYFEDLNYEPNISYKNDYENIKEKVAIEIALESIYELKHLDREIMIGRLNKQSYMFLADKFNKNKKTIIQHFNKSLLHLNTVVNKKFYDKYGINYKDEINSTIF